MLQLHQLPYMYVKQPIFGIIHKIFSVLCHPVQSMDSSVSHNVNKYQLIRKKSNLSTLQD